MIDTPEKLDSFVERILIYGELLQRIRNERGYKSFEVARLIFTRERLYE
jgi:hypothetical protein